VRHRIDGLHVAHPESEPGPGQQIGRLAHGLHPSGHRDTQIAGPDRLIREADRAHSGGAHLVDGLRRHLARDSGLDLGLTGGDLALSGLEHLSVDHRLDLLGIHLGALESRLDRPGAEVRRAEGGEAPSHLAEGSAGGTEDHRLGHLSLSWTGGRPAGR